MSGEAEKLKEELTRELPNYSEALSEEDPPKVRLEYEDLMHDDVHKVLQISYNHGFGAHFIANRETRMTIIFSKSYYGEARAAHE